MTFQAQAQVVGGEVVRIVELIVPRCVLRYGNQPCTAGARAVPHPNLIQQSEVFSGGGSGGDWSGSAVMTFSSFVAPNSTLTGVLLVDSHDASANLKTYRINANQPNFAALAESAWLDLSVHVLKKPSSEPTFSLRVQLWNGVTSADLRYRLDAATGVWSMGDTTGNMPIEMGGVVDCGSWWRAQMRFNRFSANSIHVHVYPAMRAAGTLAAGIGAAEVGSHGVWGAQLYAHNSGSAPWYPYIARGVESQWLTTGLAGACYQSPQTCQDLANYLKGEQSIFFVDEGVSLPLGLDGYPALVDVSLNPSRLNPQFGIGESAELTVELRDFPDNDRGQDPYVDARSYNPNSQGTFFGRLFARDPYIHGKKIKYHEGYYAGSGTFTFSHYLTREFIVDEHDRPDYKGRVRIRGTDILRLTNGDRALCPLPSTATLQANITAVDTVVTMASSAAAAYLAGDPHIRVDDEIMFLVTQTGATWTVSRGAGLTVAAVHSTGALVQLCKTYSYTSVTSVLGDLVANFTSIPSSYIPVNSWDAERAATLTDYNLYNILSKPTAVRDHIKDVTQACDIALWYDEVSAKIALKHQSPWTAPALTLSDSAHFVADTMTIKAREDVKVSRVGIRYAPTNYADPGDFSRFQMAVNSMREDARFDGLKSEYVIETAWLSSSHDALAATIAGRTMRRYSDLAPLEAEFHLDAAMVSSARTGDVVEMATRLLQDVEGAPELTRVQVIESGPSMAAHRYRYNALLYRGLAAATSLSIDVSTYNYNVHSAMGGPTAAVLVYLTVNSGVHVGGSGSGQAAITTSGLPAGSIVYLTPIGSSMVLGYAGARGIGGQAHAEMDTGGWVLQVDQLPTGGTRGGTAFYVADGVTAYIDVSAGYLLAGGPGGGGGGITWFGTSTVTNGGDGGLGQGFTNSGGPSAPGTTGHDGGAGAVWGGLAQDGEDGNYADGGIAGAQGFAVELASASAVYFFVDGYDSDHVKGLVGL